MKFAIIDLGTNSVRLYLYNRQSDGTFSLISRRKDMVQLGEALFHEQIITEQAWSRTLDTLKIYSTIINSAGITEVHAIATCAMREALNGEQLKEQALAEANINLKIISGAEEAQLISSGVLSNLKGLTGDYLLVDIGGGSTELSLVRNESVISFISLPLGAVRCQEQQLKGGYPPMPDDIEKLRGNIADLTENFLVSLPNDLQNLKIIGSSGSVRALHRMVGAITGEKINKSNSPVWVLASQLQKIISNLKNLNLDQIQEQYDFELRRAQVILAAAIILDELSIVFKAKEFTAVTAGLKDGILAKL
jgi:exopolyphosphatase/guanosine-5'-triphosphate,3'-diphosphate pyrophosphatase